jgi:hypothetical protein
MAYSALSDSQIDADSPLIADTFFKLRDNPIAIANGDVGAPRIQTAAIQDDAVTAAKLAEGTAERDWVLGRTAAASVDAVGTYAFAHYSGAGSPSPGSTVSGSSLTFGTAYGGLIFSPILSGTWRLMGNFASPNNETQTSLWLRIS